jgi:hypothetical protein
MKLPRSLIVLTALAITANLTAIAFADDSSNTTGNQSHNFQYVGLRSHGDPVNNSVQDSQSGDGASDSASSASSADGSPVADLSNGDLDWLSKFNSASKNHGPTGFYLPTGSPANKPISCRGTCQTLTGTVALIPVWVGNWASGDITNWNAVLGNIVNSLGGATANSVALPGHVFNTETLYFTSQGLTPPSLQWVQNTDITDPTTTTVADIEVSTHINSFITSHPNVVPAGTTPVYIYIGANSTLLTSGFGTTYCGWHSYGASNWGGLANVPYIAFQDFTSLYNKACAPQTTSPNGSASLDAMASVMVHEVDEVLTDPFLGAWYDAVGAENADKCARTYGVLFSIGTARYNVQMGSLKYLIQQNWLENNIVTSTGNTSGTACSITG